MRVAVIGTGYVGLVAGACFADTGNRVICVDKDENKIEVLNSGGIPIYEPGLSDIVNRNIKSQRISFTTDLPYAVQNSEVIFIAVGTPQDEDGSADLSHVLEVAKEIASAMNGYKVIVNKSTVPVGTAEKVRELLASLTEHEFDVVSNPEFLKEGTAIDDFLKPDRVVIGTTSKKAEKIMRDLYAPFVRTDNPILVMDEKSAEITKYAANAILASRISFMNEIANLCKATGADVDLVRKGIGFDPRIGKKFLFAGIGYGGSCFPKDVQAIIRTGIEHGVELLTSRAAQETNERQKRILIQYILDYYGGSIDGKVFAVWGLSFKPRTDDTREAPSLVICDALLKKGATIRAHDPEAIESFKMRFGERAGISYFIDQYEAVKTADALVICTEWNAFRHPEFDKLRSSLTNPTVFDGRNIFNLDQMKELGFDYISIGRPDIISNKQKPLGN